MTNQNPTNAKKSKTALIALLVSLVALGVLGMVSLGSITNFIARFQIEDYQGEPGPVTQIVIESGDTGEDVARKLLAADVVKSFDAIYREMLNSDFSDIYPGTYEFPTKISGAQALRLLISGDNKVVLTVTIPEGYRNSQVVEKLSGDLSLSKEDLNAAIEAALSSIPEQAVNLEGYLFPATYEFDPGVSATEVIGRMISRTEQELAKYEISLADSFDVIRTASVIQLEAMHEEDFFKVSRVIQNRLDRSMLLQMDSTVNYGTNGTKITTTDAQRSDPNLYNTYVHKGLPVGPIGNPGATAIEAALRPADGEWLYFVTVNLKTGETVFSETYAQHEIAAQQFYKWLRENPDWND
ncbi:MAG: endolytic transglycosylase MltG [Actinomycetota bacterium]